MTSCSRRTVRIGVHAFLLVAILFVDGARLAADDSRVHFDLNT